MNVIVLLGGIGIGMGLLTLALVAILGWAITKTPERVAKINQTGTTAEPVARMRASPSEPEDRVRKAMRDDAIEVGARNLMKLAEENGKALSYEDAKERAAMLVDQVYAAEQG